MPRYIVTKGRLSANKEKKPVKAVFIDAAAPRNAATAFTSRVRCEYNDRIWVYGIGNTLNQEFVVTVEPRNFPESNNRSNTYREDPYEVS